MMLLNSESTTLSGFTNWIPRQVIQGKLYHPNWIPVLTQAILTGFILIAGPVTNFTNLFLVNWIPFCILGSCLSFSWFASYFLFIYLNKVIVQNNAVLTSEPKPNWLTLNIAFKLLWAAPIALGVHLIAMTKVLTMRRIEWRGISYLIRKPYEVELEEYKPFTQLNLDSQYSL